MAGNQEHIRHSKFRSFYSARTIFLDFSLFGRGQRAGDLLKGFVLRDATLSGHTGAAELHTGPGRGACPAAPTGAMLGHRHSPTTRSTKPGAPHVPRHLPHPAPVTGPRASGASGAGRVG